MSAMSTDMALEELDRRKHRNCDAWGHCKPFPHKHDNLVLLGELVAMVGLGIAFLVIAASVAQAIIAALSGGMAP